MSGAQAAPSRWDVTLAVALVALGEAELFTSYAFERTDEPGPTALHVAVPILIGSALAWRRVYPLWVAPVVMAVLVVEAWASVLPNVYTPIVVQIIAVFSLAAYARPRPALVSGALVLVLGVLLGLADPDDVP